jgi:glycosyltransferase involved in cell wall biosynthesis
MREQSTMRVTKAVARGTRIDNEETTPHGRRLLLLAYACNPYMGSEPGTGWHRAVEAGKYFDTWVLCWENRDAIERFVKDNGPVPHVRFNFVPGLPYARFLMRHLRPFGYLAYNWWHRRAFEVARRLHAEHHFDVVHQANMCGFREPGYLWRLDAPFVWGPIGGTQNYPTRFLPQAGLLGLLKEGSRSIVNGVQLRLSRRVRRAAREAAVVLTANPVGKVHFERIHGVDPICMLDVGVSSVVTTPRNYDRADSTLRLLWVGGLQHHKALQLLLRALGRLSPDVDYRLRIVGSGPLEQRWRRLATSCGVAQRCEWTGHLAHDQALRQYTWADVFVFTSLRDTFGTVVLEALSRGLPVICLDHQGAGAVVTSSCGVKVPLDTVDGAIASLAAAVERLADDRSRLRNLSRGAIDRAREYLWEKHGSRIAEVYQEVINRRSGVGPERPNCREPIQRGQP